MLATCLFLSGSLYKPMLFGWDSALALFRIGGLFGVSLGILIFSG